MDNTALQPVLDALLEELATRVAGRIAPQRKELYTVQDLCERYGVSDDTITRWMRAGEFGETVNPTPRIHLATLAGITEFDANQPGRPRQNLSVSNMDTGGRGADDAR